MVRKSLAILLALSMVSPAIAAEVKLKSALTGSPTTDADGSGTFGATVDTTKGELCYDLAVKNIDTPRAAHIHKGAAGTGGPPVVPLDTPAMGSSKGCATIGADLAAAIVADPAGYYVNVHTAAVPGGAIRGQLSK